MRPERSTRSRKTSFPMSRRAITRPARRRVVSALAPASTRPASARTAATSSRSGKRFGIAIEASLGAALWHRGGLRRLDIHDLEPDRAAGRRDLDRLALLAAHDGAADGRLVRELVLRRVRLGRADDVVLDGLVGLDVPEPHLRADRDLAGLDLLLRDDARVLEPLLEEGDPCLEVGLF